MTDPTEEFVRSGCCPRMEIPRPRPDRELTRGRQAGTMVTMRMLPRSLVSWVTLSVITVAVSACASTGDPLTGPTEFDTLVPGWEFRFSVDWKVEPAQDGTNRLYGRISSHYGQYAAPFRVLGMAVDSSGKVVAQRIEWVRGGVPGFSQTYFEINHLAVAPSYRVTVWDYTLIEAPGAIR
jgi:hypothetical protein